MREYSVYLLWWEYSDHSGSPKFMRVYEDKIQADRDFEMFDNVINDGILHLDEVPFQQES